MVDFNTKKNILQKLRKKRSENKLLWLPCVIAAAFVKLWYGTVCGIGMAFSDRNGNFLGIKMHERKPKSRRQDDIVYVKKPFIGRVMSAVLAAAFVLMVAPELDLVDLWVTASAADVDMGTTITDEDNNVYYYNPENKDRVFLKSDYDKAVAYTVNSITCEAGYNTIVIRWTLPDVEIDSMSGFVVELVDSNGTVRNTKAPMTSGERLGKYQNSVTYTRDDIGSYTGNVRVVIRPITYINQWNYSAAESDENGNVTKPATFDPLQTTEAYQYLCYGKSTQTADVATIPLDARFNPPEITVPVTKTSDSYTTSVHLEWSAAQQIGGQNIGADADGYNIYRRRENGNFEKIANVTNGTSYDDDSLINGYRYEYFIEAYRSVWGGPAYDPSNPGLITSNGATTLGTGINDSNVSDIANTVYTSFKKTVYIAPAEPDLIVTSRPGRNSIELRWGPTSGDYSGVILLRTKGEDSELDPNDPLLAAAIGDKRFSDWLLETAQNKANPYGLERIAQLAKNENTRDDTDIIEGETYWYYA
ncbi:MAG: fibronectin type III domain-containing protein, partial [Oscillospiraceae bacterium]|nr:fibronectin type III domain-containing protein [Oscillospiraceae bacterium]